MRWPWRWRPFARRRRELGQLPDDMKRRLAIAVDQAAGELGLSVVGDGSGSEMVIRNEAGELRVLSMHHEWCDVEAEERAIVSTATTMLGKIAREHGHGRVWTYPLLGIVHFVYDDGVLVLRDRHDRPRVRLRAVYFHEACARPLAEAT